MGRIPIKSSETSERKSINQNTSTAKGSGVSLASPSYGIYVADTPSSIRVQAKLKNKPKQEKKYEQEADKLALLAVKNINSSSQSETPQISKSEAGKTIQRKGENNLQVSTLSAPERGISVSQKTAKSLNRSSNKGNPLASEPRAQMEAAFGADFSQVRVHTDSNSVRMNQEIGAKAFTYGSDIYFNQGMFAPDSYSGKLLLAHELTHTLQQQSTPSIQRKSEQNTEEEGGIFARIVSFLEKYANDIPGYSLLSVVVGYDIIRGKRVLRTPENLLRGVMGLAPGGDRLYTALAESGALTKAFQWLKIELENLNISLDRIKSLLFGVKDEIGILDVFSGDVIDILKDAFTPLLKDLETFGTKALIEIFTFFKETLLIPVAKLAAKTPGYQLLIKILGKDPITNKEVKATTEEILTDLLIFLGKEQELEEMKKRGTLKKTADWLDKQKETFIVVLGQLQGAFMEVWDNFVLDDWLADPLAKLKEVVERFKEPVSNFLAFAWTVAKKVLQFIKDALLRWLGTYLKDNLRGFKLLTVILKKDPITGEAVEQTGENLILGFLSLILPDDRIQEIEKTGVIQQTIDWIMAKVGELGMSWDTIVQLFLDIWNSVTIEDLIEPVKTFARIIEKFGEPIMKILAFVKDVVIKVVEVILQIMQFPIDVIQSIIAKAKEAYEDIKRDPVRFLLNLLDAVKLGFAQFFENIGTHLLGGVKAWLFKQLEKAGITPPKDLSLSSILKLVMEVLGITMQKIFAKIEKKIGKEKMDQIRSMGEKVLGIWNFINDIINGGPAAIWEKIQEQLSNLWDTVVGFVQDWITENIVNKVVAKLMSMLDPTGIMAVVNSVMALYDSIRSAIEYFTEMLEIVNSFVGGVAEIAKGSLSRAADFLEKALSDGMPVAIGYLANLIGLDGLADKLGDILAKVRLKVDEAIDWLIDKAIEIGSNLLQKGKDALGKLKEWWQAKKEFKANNGETHTLFFKGSEDNATFMIASKEQTFKEFISGIEVGEDKDKKEAKDEALKLLDTINEIKKRKTAAPTKEEVKKNKEKKKVDLQKELDKLSPHVAKLFGIKGDLPESKIEYHTINIGGEIMGDKMEASILSKKGEPGSAPKEKHNVFTTLLARRDGGRSYYIRGHLLNDNIHGPGVWKNMTILSQDGNKKHLDLAESKIKDAVLSGSVVSYTVDVIYNRSSLSVDDKDLEKAGIAPEKWEEIKKIREAEQHVPTALTLHADLLTPDEKGEFTKKKSLLAHKSVFNPVDTNLANYEIGKGKPRKNVSLANSSAEEIVENVRDVQEGQIIKIQKFASKAPNLNYYEDIRVQIIEANLTKKEEEAYMEVVSKLKKARNVTLT